MQRYVVSNQGWVFCKLFPAAQDLTAVYCGDVGLSEGARLCALMHQDPSASETEARQASSRWISIFSMHIGPASEGDSFSATWTANQRDIAVWVSLDSEKGYTSTVLYRTPEGRAVFEGGRPPFPNGAGGFEFGSSPKQVEAECKRRHGVFALVKDLGGLAFGCANPTVASDLRIAIVGGLFCSGKLCELTMTPTDEPSRVVDVMSKKYGAVEAYHEYSAHCRSESTRRMWMWASDGETTGVVRLMVDCTVAITYDNADGWAMRTAEREQRKQTY